MATAGKRGTCPRCRSSIVVADDLGSLWLSGEDTSSATLADQLVFMTEDSHASQTRRRPGSRYAGGGPWDWPLAQWAAVGTAIVIGIAIGRLTAGARQPADAEEQKLLARGETAASEPSFLSQFDDLAKSHAAVVDKLQKELDTAKAALDAATVRIRNLERKQE